MQKALIIFFLLPICSILNAQELDTYDFNSININNWMKVPHVNGRLATQEDVKNNRAIYISSKSEKYVPLDLDIPFLAYFINARTERKDTVVVIQANMTNDGIYTGFRSFHTGGYGTSLLKDLVLINTNQLIRQEKIGMKEVYIHNNLVYKISNDSLLNGVAQRKRKNGHLVYEEEYKKGVILVSKLYFNGKAKIVSNKSIYNPKKPQVLSKEYAYNLNGEIIEVKTYDDNGVKVLLEQFQNGKLTYSCQYIGKKKHGLELGYIGSKDGKKPTYRCEYVNGKKHGTQYCLNEKGIEEIKRFNNGKRIKTTIVNKELN